MKQKTSFLKIKCECGNEQVTYSHASTRVSCAACSKEIIKPTGGKSKIDATIIKGF